MKNYILRLVHIVLLALITTFAEFAPVSEDWGFYAFIGAYAIGAIKVLYDCIVDFKRKNILNGNLTVFVGTLVLMLFGFYLQATLGVIVFLLFELIHDYIVSKNNKKAENLSNIMPKEVTIFKNSVETVVDMSQIGPGRVVIVREGEIIPADGRVFKGKSTVDIGLLTGQRKNVDVSRDDIVYAGSINMGKTLQIEITKLPDESLYNKMISSTITSMKEEEQLTGKVLKRANIISVVLIVLGILISVVPPLIWGDEYEPWVYRGMIVLIAAAFDKLPNIVRISSTSLIYDLFFDGVITNKNIVGKIANTNGILLERTQRFAEGSYKIAYIHGENSSKEELITMAAHLEYFSDHLIAKTIVDGFIQVARYEGIVDINPVRINLVENFEEIKGSGVTGNVAGKFVCVGNKKLMELLNIRNLPERTDYELIYVAIDQEYCGYIALEYHQKPGVEDVYAAWSKAGIEKYAVLDGKVDEITDELREEVGEGADIAYVGVDNHYGEGDTADYTIIVDCMENKMISTGDVMIMDGSLSDIAAIKTHIVETMDASKKAIIISTIPRIILFGVTAGLSLPLCLPMIIDGIITSLVTKNIYTK